MSNKWPGDDRSLVEACIKKDLRAWSALISKYSRLAYISVDKRLKKYGVALSSHDIEDICQDVFTMIWREEKLKNISNAADISYWISIVSGNAAIDHIRRNETKESLKMVSISEKFKDKEDFADILPSRSLRPDDDTAEIEMAEKIDRAINKLPSREKLIIKLHLMHDKKYEDIADMLGFPKGTVSSYIKRAKEELRRSLKELGP